MQHSLLCCKQTRQLFSSVLSEATEEYFFAIHQYLSHKGMLGLILTTTVESGEMVCFWTQTITKIPPKSDYYCLDHLQFYMKFACKFIPWYLHYVDKLTSKKYAKTINLLCAGNKVLVKYQAQEEWSTPPTPCARSTTPTPCARPLNINYQPSKLKHRRKIQSTPRHISS